MAEKSISIRWLFLPPFTALLTLLAASALASGDPIPVDSAVWGLVGLLFAVLTILYALFIQRDYTAGLLPVQLLAQGLLLCPLSLRLGAHMLQWVGVTMTVCGSVVLLVLYYRSRLLSAQTFVIDTAAPAEFSALPVPFAVTNEEGTVVIVSDALLRLTGRSREDTEGQMITLLLPLDKDTVILGDKEWRILQSPMKNTSTEGDRYYFQLEEIHGAQIIANSSTISGGSFFDPATSLFSRSYAQQRVVEELYRVRRYQRWVSAALLRMEFTYSSAPHPEQEELIFLSYCAFVKKHTREIDISCLIGPRDILLVMPETDLDSALEVVSKLSDFVSEMQEILAGFPGIANVASGTLFFNASSGSLSFEGFLDKLDEELESSRKRFD